MKVYYTSDLHLEFYRDAPMVVLNALYGHITDGDVLVLAGDITTDKTLGTTVNLLNDAIEWLNFKHIVFVGGNHEFYGADMVDVRQESWATAELKEGVHILDPGYVDIDGVRFLGGILWTDYNKEDHKLMNHGVRSMNDFRVIKYNGHSLTPEHILAEHKADLEVISTVGKNTDGPLVVVTHHAPSDKSTQDRYEGDAMNKLYHSDLDDIVEEMSPDFWIHGHMHSSNDYFIGKTHVLSNPFGYKDYEENPAWGNLFFEV